MQVTVTIDASECLDELTDEEIVAEARDRNLTLGLEGDLAYSRDYVERAAEALVQKRYAEAIALLDRALFPSAPPLANVKKMDKKAPV